MQHVLLPMKQSTIISAAALSVVLAGSAVFNVVLARKAEKKTPPEGEFIEVDSVRLHYVEKGSGPPLILLHGNGAMLQDYELSGLIGEAAKQYRVIAFDRPGFGYSERPRNTVWTPANQAGLIFKAAQMLGVRKPVIVGHSWGTLVALAAALDHPSDVAGLVLLSGYYFPSARPDVVLFSPPAIPGLGDILRFTASPCWDASWRRACLKLCSHPRLSLNGLHGGQLNSQCAPLSFVPLQRTRRL